jgi:hypothetical protein
MYGCVAGVENRLAASGTPVELNPYATAYKYRGTDRRGGFGLEAAKVINSIGVPRKSVLPEFTKTRSWNRDVSRDAGRHKISGRTTSTLRYRRCSTVTPALLLSLLGVISCLELVLLVAEMIGE